MTGKPNPFNEASPDIAAFFAWAEAQAKTLGRRLTRRDLPLEAVARWAPQMKIIERDAGIGDLRVRLFGTGMADIYGRDLTGQKLRDVLPASVAEQLLAGYARAAGGAVVYENVRFEWGDGKSVAYERLIYPLENEGALSLFVVVGYRMRGERHFLLAREGIRHVSSDLRVLVPGG
ncbi:MAG: PAS domain-containing protein [Telmatospirillum sp.]|nr:PAS domain-containing protein [Telmatospirillum sp.]